MSLPNDQIIQATPVRRSVRLSRIQSSNVSNGASSRSGFVAENIENSTLTGSNSTPNTSGVGASTRPSRISKISNRIGRLITSAGRRSSSESRESITEDDAAPANQLHTVFDNEVEDEVSRSSSPEDDLLHATSEPDLSQPSSSVESNFTTSNFNASLRELEEVTALPYPDDYEGPTVVPLECAICLQRCVHPAKLPCRHIFCFLCLKGIAQQSRRCAMCRTPIPHDYLDRPELVEVPEPSTLENGYQWFYEGRNGWWQYEDRISQDLETSYQNGDRMIELLIAGNLYTIDFNFMIQYRKVDPNKKRRIKRDIGSSGSTIKGIAGLRIGPNIEDIDGSVAGGDVALRNSGTSLGQMMIGSPTHSIQDHTYSLHNGQSDISQRGHGLSGTLRDDASRSDPGDIDDNSRHDHLYTRRDSAQIPQSSNVDVHDLRAISRMFVTAQMLTDTSNVLHTLYEELLYQQYRARQLIQADQSNEANLNRTRFMLTFRPVFLTTLEHILRLQFMIFCIYGDFLDLILDRLTYGVLEYHVHQEYQNLFLVFQSSISRAQSRLNFYNDDVPGEHRVRPNITPNLLSNAENLVALLCYQFPYTRRAQQELEQHLTAMRMALVRTNTDIHNLNRVMIDSPLSSICFQLGWITRVLLEINNLEDSYESRRAARNRRPFQPTFTGELIEFVPNYFTDSGTLNHFQSTYHSSGQTGYRPNRQIEHNFLQIFDRVIAEDRRNVMNRQRGAGPNQWFSPVLDEGLVQPDEEQETFEQMLSSLRSRSQGESSRQVRRPPSSSHSHPRPGEVFVHYSVRDPASIDGTRQTHERTRNNSVSSQYTEDSVLNVPRRAVGEMRISEYVPTHVEYSSENEEFIEVGVNIVSNLRQNVQTGHVALHRQNFTNSAADLVNLNGLLITNRDLLETDSAEVELNNENVPHNEYSPDTQQTSFNSTSPFRNTNPWSSNSYENVQNLNDQHEATIADNGRNRRIFFDEHELQSDTNEENLGDINSAQERGHSSNRCRNTQYRANIDESNAMHNQENLSVEILGAICANDPRYQYTFEKDNQTRKHGGPSNMCGTHDDEDDAAFADLDSDGNEEGAFGNTIGLRYSEQSNQAYENQEYLDETRFALHDGDDERKRAADFDHKYSLYPANTIKTDAKQSSITVQDIHETIKEMKIQQERKVNLPDQPTSSGTVVSIKENRAFRDYEFTQPSTSRSVRCGSPEARVRRKDNNYESDDFSGHLVNNNCDEKIDGEMQDGIIGVVSQNTQFENDDDRNEEILNCDNQIKNVLKKATGLTFNNCRNKQKVHPRSNFKRTCEQDCIERYNQFENGLSGNLESDNGPNRLVSRQNPFENMKSYDELEILNGDISESDNVTHSNVSFLLNQSDYMMANQEFNCTDSSASNRNGSMNQFIVHELSQTSNDMENDSSIPYEQLHSLESNESIHNGEDSNNLRNDENNLEQPNGIVYHALEQQNPNDSKFKLNFPYTEFRSNADDSFHDYTKKEKYVEQEMIKRGNVQQSHNDDHQNINVGDHQYHVENMIDSCDSQQKNRSSKSSHTRSLCQSSAGGKETGSARRKSSYESYDNFAFEKGDFESSMSKKSSPTNNVIDMMDENASNSENISTTQNELINDHNYAVPIHNTIPSGKKVSSRNLSNSPELISQSSSVAFEKHRNSSDWSDSKRNSPTIVQTCRNDYRSNSNDLTRSPMSELCRHLSSHYDDTHNIEHSYACKKLKSTSSFDVNKDHAYSKHVGNRDNDKRSTRSRDDDDWRSKSMFENSIRTEFNNEMMFHFNAQDADTRNERDIEQISNIDPQNDVESSSIDLSNGFKRSSSSINMGSTLNESTDTSIDFCRSYSLPIGKVSNHLLPGSKLENGSSVGRNVEMLLENIRSTRTKPRRSSISNNVFPNPFSNFTAEERTNFRERSPSISETHSNYQHADSFPCKANSNSCNTGSCTSDLSHSHELNVLGNSASCCWSSNVGSHSLTTSPLFDHEYAKVWDEEMLINKMEYLKLKEEKNSSEEEDDEDI